MTADIEDNWCEHCTTRPGNRRYVSLDICWPTRRRGGRGCCVVAIDRRMTTGRPSSTNDRPTEPHRPTPRRRDQSRDPGDNETMNRWHNRPATRCNCTAWVGDIFARCCYAVQSVFTDKGHPVSSGKALRNINQPGRKFLGNIAEEILDTLRVIN